MGFIFSCQNSQNCLARYQSGTVYLGHSTLVCGNFNDGKVYDEKGNAIGIYSERKMSPSDKNEKAFFVNNNCVYRGEKPYAFFQGDAGGACAAAYLHYRYQSVRNTSESSIVESTSKKDSGDTYWTFKDFWKNINERVPLFVKILIFIVFLIGGYNAIQLPAVIAYLLEQEIGWMMLCVWGGAFLLGFCRNTYPQFKGMYHVISWMWSHLIPYLHVAWIVVIIVCIHAMANEFFSFSYLAGVLYYLPITTVLPLTIPLYLINLARSLYLLYKYKR